jgi:ATP-dependent DNA ligase
LLIWSVRRVPSLEPKARAHRHQGRIPGFIEPALAKSIDNVPSGARWVLEIKFDGYRVQVHLNTSRCWKNSSPQKYW